MSKSDPYFQFPLCFLAFGDSHQMRLEHIISFGVLNAGRVSWERTTREGRQEIREKVSGDSGRPYDLSVLKTDHLIAWHGARITGVRLGSVQAAIKESETAEKFENDFFSKHGRGPNVRIKTDWVFQSRDGDGLTAREFGVLCAIYSRIGQTPNPVLIYRSEIVRRALGYRTQAIMDTELPNRTDGEKPLTERQLRDTIEELSARGFFAKLVASRTQAYFSNKLTRQEMFDTLCKIEGLRRKHGEEQKRLSERLNSLRRNRGPSGVQVGSE